MDYLQITLLRPLHTSGGSGRAGDVDHDVAFDACGLPILPARRLKGLWRDAYRDLSEALDAVSVVVPSPDDLFGEPGAFYEKTARFRLADAQLVNADMLQPWLVWGLKQGVLLLDEVQEQWTAIRTQTAMDRTIGSARENTLRRTRVLREGLVFRARLDWRVEPSEQTLSQLALGAAALQRMGLMRTRGVGEVRCELLHKGENWTEKALKDAGEKASFGGLIEATDKATEAPRSDASQASAKKESMSLVAASSPITTGATSRTIPTHLLRYRLRLNAKAILPALEGDANTTLTQTSVSGRSLLGLFAWRYLRQETQGMSPDARFWRIFGGDVLFLPAYPEERGEDEDRQRLLPLAHSLRRKKEEDGKAIDLCALSEDESPPPVKRLRTYGRQDGQEIQTQEVRTSMSYHHFRAKDRRYGRAIGAESGGEGGGLFVAESLEAGQSFQGALVGGEEELAFLRGLWGEGGTCFLGRSRSAEYGGEAFLEWLDKEPCVLDQMMAQEHCWQEASKPVPQAPVYLFRCLSPMFTVNANGHPCAVFPLEEIAERLGVDASRISVKRSWTRTEWVGGYWSHLRLPRPQWPAISAGSVFAIAIQADASQSQSDWSAYFAEMERTGLGLWCHEGFGQVAIHAEASTSRSHPRSKELSLKSIEAHRPKKPETASASSPVLRSLWTGVLIARCRADLLERSLSWKVSGGLTNALVGRLSLIFRQNTLPQTLQKLSELRDSAKNKLKQCDVRLDAVDIQGIQGTRTNLFTLLCALCEHDQAQRRAWLQTALSKASSAGALSSLVPKDSQSVLLDKAVQEVGESLVKAFLLNWFGQMRRDSRAKGEVGGKS